MEQIKITFIPKGQIQSTFSFINIKNTSLKVLEEAIISFIEDYNPEKIINISKNGYFEEDFEEKINSIDLAKMKFKSIEKYLGSIPTQKELAKYLDVTEGAVSQYDKKKKELMIFGLWIKSRLNK